MPKRNESPKPVNWTDAGAIKELSEGMALLYSELLAQVGGGGDDSPTPDSILLAASETIGLLGVRAPVLQLVPESQDDEDETEEKPKRKRSARKRRDDDGDLPFDDEDEEDEQPKRRKRSSGRKARGGGGGGRARKPRDASAYCACGCDCWQDYDEDYSGCDCDGDDCVNEYNGKETPCGCIRPKPLVGGDVVMVEGKNGQWRWLEEVA